MNAMNEKIEPNTALLIKVDRPKETIGSTSRTDWLDRFEDWIDFLKDVVKILAE